MAAFSVGVNDELTQNDIELARCSSVEADERILRYAWRAGEQRYLCFCFTYISALQVWLCGLPSLRVNNLFGFAATVTVESA
jgi:hypothetical protein